MKTNMKLTMLAAVALALSAANESKADPITYDFTFNGGGSDANGQLIINNGVATAGYLDVTAGAGIGDYNLYTWVGEGSGTSSFRVNGGTDLIVDNLVNPGSNPALDVYGLGFYSSALIDGQPAEGMALSLLSGTTINLEGFGTDGYGDPNANGELTLTPCTCMTTNVPDGMNTGTVTLAALGGMFCVYGYSSRRKTFSYTSSATA